MSREEFRVKSPFFAQLCWKTDVLLTSGGLEDLNGIPSFSVRVSPAVDQNSLTNLEKRYLGAVLRQEAMPSTDRGLSLLQIFCENGLKPLNPGSKDSGLFVKELIKYRVLDIAAFVFEKGSCPKAQPRRNLTAATIQKLVCPSNYNHNQQRT
jgi:hypothetical protein